MRVSCCKINITPKPTRSRQKTVKHISSIPSISLIPLIPLIPLISLITLTSCTCFAQSTQTNFSGRSDIYTNYSSQRTNNNPVPPFYSYWTGSQQVSALDLPFEVNWHFTSLQSSQRPLSPNMISFRFNSEKLRSTLRQRAQQQIKKKLLDSEETLIRINSLSSDKEKLQSILSNPQVMKELQQLEQSDSIQRVLDEKRGELSNGQIINLEQKLKEFEQVEAKRHVYESLVSKKREIDGLREKYSKYDTIPVDLTYDYDLLDNPKMLKEKLTSANLISKWENAGLWVECLQFGRILPYWSELTLNGTTLDGIEVAVAPANIYAGAVAGMIYPVQAYGYLQDSVEQTRSMIGASVGYGSTAVNHFRVNILQFKDGIASAGQVIDPSQKANYVINALIDLSMFKGKVNIHSSIAGSQTTYDQQMTHPALHLGQAAIPKPDDPSEWMSNIFQQKKTSLNFSTGYAYTGNILVQPIRKGPVIKGSIRHIEPFYQSFGVPFLPNDISGFESGLEQSFWRSRITLSGSLSYYTDNLENLKPYTTGWQRYTASMRVNLPRLPSVILMYSPIYQVSENPVYINSWIVQAVLPVIRNQWRSQYSAFYSNQSSKSDLQPDYDSIPSFNSHTISFQAFIQAPLNFQLSANGTYFNRSSDGSADVSIYGFRITPRYIFFKKWENGIGINLYHNTISKQKTGIHYETSLKFFKRFSLTLRAEYDMIKSIIQGDDTIQSKPEDALFITSKLSAVW
ncbi:MAG: hypothetical protein ABII90_07560 [Bacteroidota bacterium]